jgi:hypothetical protein
MLGLVIATLLVYVAARFVRFSGKLIGMLLLDTVLLLISGILLFVVYKVGRSLYSIFSSSQSRLVGNNDTVRNVVYSIGTYIRNKYLF